MPPGKRSSAAARLVEPGDVLGSSSYKIFPGPPDILDGYGRALAGEAHRTRMEIGEVIFDVLWSPIRDAAGAVMGYAELLQTHWLRFTEH